MKYIWTIILFCFYSVVNTQIVAVKDSVSGREDSTIIIQVQNNDQVDVGCTNQTTIVTQALNGSATIHSDFVSIKYKPSSSFFGLDSFEYRIKGCISGLESTAWVRVFLIPTNEKPVANLDIYTLEEDQEVMIDVLGNDTDRESPNNLSAVIDKGAKNGIALVPFLDSIKYKPNLHYYGYDTFIYKICDDGLGGVSLCDTAYVYLTINPVDDPLMLRQNDTVVTTSENKKICVNLSNFVIDVDNENSWTTSEGVSSKNGSTSYTDKEICYTPNDDFVGLDSILVKVCDKDNNCQSIKVKINVTNIPDTIFAVNDTFFIKINDSVEFDPESNDINIDDLPYTISNVSIPLVGKHSLNGSKIKYLSKAGFMGVDSHKYQIQTPSMNYKSQATIYYYVGIDQNTIIANDDLILIFLDDTLKANIINNDNKGLNGEIVKMNIISYPININIISDNDNGEVNIHSGNINGYDTFNYTIENSVNVDTGMVVVYVFDRSQLKSNNDTTVLIKPANDSCIKNIDGLLNFSSITSTTNGTLTLRSDGCWVYDYSDNFEGLDSFSYEVCTGTTPVFCDTFTHYIIVKSDNSPITVPTSFSPNGDNIDDYLIIDNIHLAKDNMITVFNRWGEIVYLISDYKNDWNGINKTGFLHENSPLADGVYFYEFKYTHDSIQNIKKGYFYIKR